MQKLNVNDCIFALREDGVTTDYLEDETSNYPRIPIFPSVFVCELRAKSCIFRVLHAPLYIGVEVGPAGALLCE